MGWRAAWEAATAVAGERENLSRTSSPVEGVSPNKLSREEEEEEEEVGEAVASNNSPEMHVKNVECQNVECRN